MEADETAELMTVGLEPDGICQSLDTTPEGPVGPVSSAPDDDVDAVEVEVDQGAELVTTELELDGNCQSLDTTPEGPVELGPLRVGGAVGPVSSAPDDVDAVEVEADEGAKLVTTRLEPDEEYHVLVTTSEGLVRLGPSRGGAPVGPVSSAPDVDAVGV